MADTTAHDIDFAADALRDGEQAARERHQAEVELEQGLIRQEQELEAGTGVPIVEQADLGDDAHDDGRSVITAGQGTGTQHSGGDGAGVGIVSPGAGTDPSETQTSSGGEPDPASGERVVELEGTERVFEGEGRHPLEEQ